MDMRAGSDEAAFLEFKRDPSHERLTALLTAVQDRVYNICFQILRRAEDAEDACQEVLIEIARGVSSIDTFRPFKVWLYRVAVHTALDRKDARSRQARLVSQVPQPEEPPMTEEERAELMRAIRNLDDRTRCVVLEHYFDKMTLEEIGAREGVSAVAVWKRIDRAKELLRRALLGAGLTVGVAPLLEAITPVAAPAGLAAKTALIAGGIAVGTKTALTGTSIVAALLIFGVASTGGYLVGSARAASRVPESPSKNVTAAAPLPQPQLPAEPSHAVPQDPLPEDQTPKDKAAREPRPIDPDTVTYGRPMRMRVDGLLKAPTWEEFYKLSAQYKGLDATAYEDLIFQRVARELNLDVEDAQSLRSLFEAEREAATRFIVDNAGGPTAFAKLKEDIGKPGNKAIFDDWRRQREIVRANHEPMYLKLMRQEQLALFNEHLRNGKIQIEVGYGPDSVNYLITGVGKE